MIDSFFEEFQHKCFNGWYNTHESMFKGEAILAFGLQDMKPERVEKWFKFCWDQGHSSGYYEVFLFMVDTVEFMKD